VIVGDEHTERLGLLGAIGHSFILAVSVGLVEDEVRERIQKLLVTGDNRLKQGVDPAKARESWEQALALAREAGLEERIRPLVEVRLADLEQPPG
jgi:hypothetical protein